MILPRRTKLFLLAVILLAGVMVPSTTEAQTLGQILNAVDTAITRATQARDRAVEARDTAQEIRDTIQEGVLTLSTQVRDVILESVSDLSDLIDEELAGRDAFISGPECPAFRQDLVGLVQGLEDILSELAIIADPNCPLPVSFQDEIALLNSAPCRVLFPLYRTLSVTGLLSQCLLDLIDEGAAALPLLTQILAESSQTPAGSLLDYELGLAANQLILADPVSARQAVKATNAVAMALNVLGGRLVSKGHTGLAGVEAQIHGYIGVSLETDKKMQWGTQLQSTSQMLRGVAATARLKINRAIDLAVDAELRANQERIATNQYAIMRALRIPTP
jgi:hypothetical protein